MDSRSAPLRINGHNPAARYCIALDDRITVNDDQDCAKCQELYDLMVLDPDVEVLGPRPSSERFRAEEES